MIDRRKFLKIASRAVGGVALACTGYSFLEAGWFHVVEERIVVPELPAAFKGLRIALLTDLHHGPWTGLNYVKRTVDAANELKADVILLGGDYCHNGPQYISPCIDVLGGLSAKMGVFGILGNHDVFNGLGRTRRSMDARKIPCLVNEGIWLTRGGQRLYLAGVDDICQGAPDLEAALEKLGDDETCLLLCHNPDFAEKLKDPRVGLMLSGHTHGGQVVFPLIGAPIVPSSYGQKYLNGLISLPVGQVFVSRGLGTVTPPVRFSCPPEINLIELA